MLLSGHHAAIARWRREQALRRTLARRPDLLASATLSPDDQRRLTEWRDGAATPSLPPGDPAGPPAVDPAPPDAAYATAAPLAARQSLYTYRRQPFDVHAWTLDQVTWTGAKTVLDVGCGNGLALRRLATRPAPPARLLGVDRSPGMVAAVADGWPTSAPRPLLAVADALALPLADATCDVVLAMHVLYHVPDLARALAEARRVLRPGGQLLATTNGRHHLIELRRLLVAAAAVVPGAAEAVQAGLRLAFDLERGAVTLGAVFASVERRDAIGELVVPDAGPIVHYVASMGALLSLPDPGAWPVIVAEVERRATAAIARDGAVRLATHTGVFICA